MSTNARTLPAAKAEPGLFDNELLNVTEAAKVLRLSNSTLERMRLDGTGPPFIKLGPSKRARVVYRRADIEAWLATLRFQSTSEYPRS